MIGVLQKIHLSHQKNIFSYIANGEKIVFECDHAGINFLFEIIFVHLVED